MYLLSLISINLCFYEHQKCPLYFFDLLISSVVIAFSASLLMVAVGAMSQGTMAVSDLSQISNNVVSATSKGSDQPAHTRSLIRAFASRFYEC